MGASSTKPIPQDATGSQRNLLEAQNAEAAETNERRKAAVTQMARQRMMLIEMSGGYTPGPLGGPVAGFLPHAPALELEDLVEKHEVRPAPTPLCCPAATGTCALLLTPEKEKATEGALSRLLQHTRPPAGRAAPLPAQDRPHQFQGAAGPSKDGGRSAGFAGGAALGFGAGVMKDPPKNIFGPNTAVSPDMYPEFHRARTG